MKFLQLFLISLLLINCSFDKKSGIWKDENSILKKDNDLFKDFKKITKDKEFYDEIMPVKQGFTFILGEPITNNSWIDIYFSSGNSLENLKYNDRKSTIFKGKKISKYLPNKNILFKDDKIFITDDKGNIYIFSLKDNKIITKYNFYKKKYKKIKKKLNIVIENNTIYISDNVGYLYAFDLIKKDLLWAHHYKVPFRSNLKLFGNLIVGADQNNTLFFFEKKNGEKINSIPTEETIFRSDFIGNLASYKDNIFFLNTYGSIYSINKKLSLKWFNNFNKSIDINPNNLFNGNEIIVHNDRVVISTHNNFYILNAENGSVIFKKNIVTKLKPLVVSKYVFLLSENDLLIAINLENGKIIYSLNFKNNINKYDLSKKKLTYKNLLLLNNHIYIFLENSYYFKTDIFGKVVETNKLPSSIISNPIVANGSIIYLNKNKKILIVD